ncbi:sodium:proton antiporter [Opitutaceae bacterium EW11]|nr:sodium:proton antiporter [Opitutaceae bacterium EW11]
MSVFQIVAVLLSITALFSYVNFRFFRLPTTIGVMLIALLSSGLLLGAAHLGVGETARDHLRSLLEQVRFDQTLMQGLLCFLLFAGALHVNWGELAEQKATVTLLATAGVVISTFAVGTLVYALLPLTGLELSYVYCLLFGALISPTDPIAVLSVIKRVRVPKNVELRIVGESLFNDGVGIVVFLVVSRFATEHRSASVADVGRLLLLEGAGGAAFGLLAGWVAYRVLRTIDNYQVEVLWTLGLVTGGYALASALHVSGAIAIVVAGLVIGNQGRQYAMSERTREELDRFWELLDSILNAVLFALIGLELVVLTFSWDILLAGIVAAPTVLAARWLSVAPPLLALRGRCAFDRGELALLTWGALRGGVSVALALTIPAGPERDLILAMTYTVVICSIAGQGLTLQRLAERFFGAAPRAETSHRP